MTVGKTESLSVWQQLQRRWFVLLVSVSVPCSLWQADSVYPWLSYISPRWNIAAVTSLVSLGLPLRQLLAAALQPGPVLWALLVNYGIVPIGGSLVAWLLQQWGYTDYAVGLAVCTAVPCTLASAAIWTRLAGGNDATAILVTVVSSNTAWLCTTAWLTLCLGTRVEIDAGLLMADLLAVLVGPLLIAQLLRRSSRLRTFAYQYRGWLSVVTRLLILLVILQAVAQMGLHLHSGAWRDQLWPILSCAILVPGLHLLGLAIAWQGARWFGFGRPECIAVAFAGSQKTLPVSLQIATTYFPAFPLAIIPMLFYHVGQLVLDTWIADAFLGGENQPKP